MTRWQTAIEARGWVVVDDRALEVATEVIVAPECSKVARHGIVVSVPVSVAVSPIACLCCQCGKVSETVRDCEWCGSKAMLNLSRVLDHS